MVSVDNKRGSPSKRAAESGSYDKDSSIAEESQLNQAASESRASSVQRKHGSGIIEEDIEDLVSSAQHSGSSELKPAKKPVLLPKLTDMQLHQIEREKSLEQIRKFEEERKANQEKNTALIHEFFHELNGYERATVS